jgi:CDP-glycerol glycerophosphotransferase
MIIFKYYIKCLIRYILKFFYIIPVNKNLIFIESFDGKELCCSPYYIFDYFQKHDNPYKFIVSSKISQKSTSSVKYVKTHSFTWVLAQIYSGIQIINTGFKIFIPYRKSQILINTWHGGGAYKKVGNADASSTYLKIINKTNNYVNKYLTYFISSSKAFTDVMSESLLIPKDKFLNIGLPRNDIFFNKELSNQINLQIRNKYNIENDSFVVLYAPTYRGTMTKTHFENQLNIKQLKYTLAQKYNKKIYFSYRGHYFLNSQLNIHDVDFDWTNEKNMQDLLCCCDLLITDYSSSMWDYSFTQKTCFLFTPDIDEYIKSRGFYSDPQKWGFPICKNNDELKEKILHFNEEAYKEAVKNNHQFFESYENGTATEQICKIISKEIS